jgi:hypothetical protein
MRKILGFILVFSIMMTILTGCALLDRFKSDTVNSDELTPVSSVTIGQDEAGGQNKTAIKLYFINSENKLSAETRYIDKSESAKGNDYLATVTMKELIKGPEKGSLLQSTIPKGTTLHSNVTIKDGIATVDLSKEFVSKHIGGKKNEQLTLYSIVNTLTEIKDVKSVQFKINGKVQKEFKGSYEINMAYPRSAYLISEPKSEISTGNADTTNDITSEDNKTNDSNAQPSKENTKDQTKDNTSKDKKTNTDDSNDEVETNVELLE